MSGKLRKFCVQIDPRRELDLLLLLLRKKGAATADECHSVLWVEAPLEEVDLAAMAGVQKVIEYVRPLWSDVLGDAETKVDRPALKLTPTAEEARQQS